MRITTWLWKWSMLLERKWHQRKVFLDEKTLVIAFRKETETKKRAIRRWLPGRDDKVHNPLAYQRIVTKDNAKVKKIRYSINK